MRTDALIIEGANGFDPCDIQPMNRQVKTMQLAKPYRVMIVGYESMPPISKKCTRFGADFMHPDIKASARLKNVDSLTRGLTYLRGKCDRVLIAPASFPFITTATYRQVMDSNAEIAVAECDGKRGWPVLISGSLIDETLEVGGLAALPDAHADSVEIVKTDDVDTVTDVSVKNFSVRLARTMAAARTCSHS